MVIGFLAVSGCATVADPNVDPIVGIWTFDPQLKLPYDTGMGVNYTTTNYVLAYPDFRVQFFSNHTFVSNSGKYHVISGPKDSSFTAKDIVSSGIWYNEGDGNYSLKFIYHFGYYVDGPNNQNVTYRLKDGYLKDMTATLSGYSLNDTDYKLIRLSR
jgi:hypothetical protein